jgi:hypothetical protein
MKNERKIKRIIRDRHLTSEEAAKYNAIRKKIDSELPELIKRHNERLSKEQKSDKTKGV